MMRLPWYLVVNSERTILAAYGAALRDEAIEKAAEIQNTTGLAPAVFKWSTSKRPRVGDTIPSVARSRGRLTEIKP